MLSAITKSNRWKFGGKHFGVEYPVPNYGGVSAGFHIRAGTIIPIMGKGCVNINEPTTSSMLVEGTE